MEVLVAKHAGFCVGVERAYKIALQEPENQPVYMLGNLVHNKQVVERLRARGIIGVHSLSEISAKGTLLISAHGASPEIYEEAKQKGLKIIDTTCPWVKKAQKIAAELAGRGCRVVIVGDKGHAEVKGLLGWSGGRGTVVETPADVSNLTVAENCLGMIAQTTQAEEQFQNIAAALRAKFANVEVHNTICGATSHRQSAAIEIAKQVDLMLVIGDKMSANTNRLTELCAKTGTKTFQIETAAELDPSWLTGKTKVGVTAGASTPKWITGEVISLLSKIVL
ncbi:4-hydroxy-3-methylbut-2-enyl diphosphate reductase [candidate division WOR-1 bacterium RIFOXYA12_FULL_52_29]|uniref:4-hydroxy-3-methylbut-2-enyl diphosphate reductase n=1 Tax=candidate division WOR-1 bacterium RIFOXYC12_FULL_54_18 TaxID=1802584 RepID=A0A1F4T6B2_UNCSA|nr:MAG: 4-hydroxy-3-methylbut-2-enyl diphosphate reductase [candidate division WOR-1 bacterium RIFOXYA2_FULL_51_19]OGC17878.1 MAG: 4-hydroxy-3-methylbut-2-enyl diphosphate reductase [candidate division WOR-1 bacterium RIFOXYA12_FULL_52_29]OGC26734.1 MAG: 4-hydroxy-3-methylbut-2-enyl diphosphate reductase [candidate division WOR-1 bacterium RIFOXYB2_FULL_45_9]OGC28295.1 MAG: 4-hydroxy-3-methylbut-2-enyl diphosphate reductase [candidate division WOR-1 bacterium RIFOXYC12_FULL_54_18]OGC31248.1 MAG